jgi:glycyl-tRNA synthetase alpha chain
VTERQQYLLRVRAMTRSVAEAYLATRERLGFPLCRGRKLGDAGGQ